MRTLLRITTIAGLLLATLGVTAPAQAAIEPLDYSCSRAQHCYAQRTQGRPVAAEIGGWAGSLSSVSELGGWFRADCHNLVEPIYADFDNDEMWLYTPKHTAAPYPSGGREWIEAGLTSGTFNGYGPFALSFFWGRGWLSPLEWCNSRS